MMWLSQKPPSPSSARSQATAIAAGGSERPPPSTAAGAVPPPPPLLPPSPRGSFAMSISAAELEALADSAATTCILARTRSGGLRSCQSVGKHAAGGWPLGE